ncbi:YxeA family protein [Staphylococcus saprophyticus]|nr:YxeA family protein [Staphylococcus saprophyticus]MDW4305109.1 YxeA family protein [Staphylococcus saprophyticus]MDW4398962.1 YxeA family protein [Staphylococcus saprophyticus]
MTRSKKFIIMINTVIVIIAFIFLALFAWKIYAERNYNNTNIREAAQFNPLIRETDYYVQVSDPLKKNGKNQVGAYTYMTDGFDKDGVGHTVTFNGMKKLKKGAYLKVSLFLGEAKSYNEISKDKVPHKPLKKLEMQQ